MPPQLTRKQAFQALLSKPVWGGPPRTLPQSISISGTLTVACSTAFSGSPESIVSSHTINHRSIFPSHMAPSVSLSTRGVVQHTISRATQTTEYSATTITPVRKIFFSESHRHCPLYFYIRKIIVRIALDQYSGQPYKKASQNKRINPSGTAIAADQKCCDHHHCRCRQRELPFPVSPDALEGEDGMQTIKYTKHRNRNCTHRPALYHQRCKHNDCRMQ